MKNAFKILIIVALLLLVLLAFVRFNGSGEDVALVDNAAVNGESLNASGEAAKPADAGLVFSTTALDGSTVDESIFQGKSLIMLNFWEPWCGPCVNEMPDLQKISEEYSDRGFLIVGVYSTGSGTQEIVDKLGISYPVILNCEAFDQFVTGYVPTTVFVDGEGNVVSELIVGGKSYDGWTEIIDSLLA